MGGAGGGINGEIQYPPEIKSALRDMLDRGAIISATGVQPRDVPNSSIVREMNNMLTNITQGISNGYFANSGTDWNTTSGHWLYTGSKATHVAGNTSALYQRNPLSVQLGAKIKEVSFTVEDFLLGSINVTCFGNPLGTISSDGTYRFKNLVVVDTDYAFMIVPTSLIFIGSIDNISCELLAGNPFLSAVPYDASSEDLPDLKEDIEGFDTLLTSHQLSDGDDFASLLTDYETLVDSANDRQKFGAGVSIANDVSYAAEGALRYAKSYFSDLLNSYKDQVKDTDHTGYLMTLMKDVSKDDIRSVIKAALTDVSDDVSNINTSAIENAHTKIAAKIALQLTTILESSTNNIETVTSDNITNASTLINEIKSNMTSYIQQLVSSTVDVVEGSIGNKYKAYMNSVNPEIQEMLSSAVEAVAEALDKTAVDDIVDSFERQSLNNHFRGVNRLTAGMSDIGAVNSSAFIWGLALLEEGFQRDVNQFRANMTMQLQSQLLNGYFNIYAQTLSGYIATLLQGINTYLNSYDRFQEIFSQNFLSLAGMQMQNYSAMYGGYNEAFINAFSGYIKNSVDLEQLYVNSFLQMLNLNAQQADRVLAQQSDTYNKFFAERLGNQVTRTINNEKTQLAFLTDSIGKLSTMLMARYSLTNDNLNRWTNYRAMKMATAKEYTDRELEIDYKSSVWNMQIFQHGANFLSGTVGGATYMPERPSQTANAASGAVAGVAAGAVIGSKFGGQAALLGAGIGGILGGFAGYVQ